SLSISSAQCGDRLCAASERRTGGFPPFLLARKVRNDYVAVQHGLGSKRPVPLSSLGRFLPMNLGRSFGTGLFFRAIVRGQRARKAPTMKRSLDRILTTHAGSLPRPEKLLATNRAKLDGTADATAHGATLAASVAEICRTQTGLGLDVINDGEF